MKNLEVLQKNLVQIRKKRADIIQKIDKADNDCSKTLTAEQEKTKKQIQELEKQREQEIARLEKEHNDKLQAWKKTRDGYLTEKNRYWRQLKKTFTDSYIPIPRPLNSQEVRQLKASLEKGGWFTEKYSKALYCAYKDAIANADEQTAIIKNNARIRIDRAWKDTEAKIQQIRKQSAAADNQTNYAHRQEKWKYLDALEAYDDSEYLWKHYRPLENLRKELRARETDWTVYTPAKTLPANLFLGSVHTLFPAVPDKKRPAKDFGLESWARRDNEIYWDIPVYSDLNRSSLVILSSDRSLSQTNSPDKVLARQLLCRLLKHMPPQSAAWSVLDPIHKGTSLGRLIEVADIGSMELNFRLFSDKKGCEQEQQRLARRPREIIQAMAGRYSSLYEYNKAHADSPYPFVWYADFGFTGKDSETDAIRELLTTAQTAGTSFLFATTGQGAQTLQALAKACAHTLPVVHINCDTRTLSVNGGPGESYIAADGPDNDRLDAFVRAVKKQFTVDLKAETAFGPTLVKHRFAGRQPATTAPSLPYAINGRKELMRLTLDGKENSHAYICGKAGSGKSTLLHTLILGACLRYAPGDLELWLADFKMDELRHYHEYCLPQVTLVAAGQDPDLSYSLVDRIASELLRRSALFARFPLVKDLDGYRTHEGKPGYEKIPVLMIVIDEFSVMSEALAKNEDYKKKLERVFRQARSRGIRLVLADQTYGLKGLTEEAMDQIGIRIAMQNPLKTVKDTLQAEGYTYTDADNKTLAGLTPGDLVIRLRVGQEREIRLEKYRGLYTTPEDVRNFVSHMKKKPKPPVYVDEAGEKRTAWNPKDMLAMEEYDPVSDYGVRLYLGRGYSLQPCFAVNLGQESYQNLSIVGGKPLQRWEVVRSVLLSCRRNGYEPLVFLPKGSNFKPIEEPIRRLCREIPKAKLMETYSQWCAELLRLKKRMADLEDTDQTVCIFLNLELAAEDLKEYPEWRAEDTAPEPVSFADRLLMQYAAKPADQTPGKVFNAMPIIRQLLKSGYRSNLYSVAEIGTAMAFEGMFREREVSQHRIAFSMSAESMSRYLGSRQDHDKIAEGSELGLYYGSGSRLYKLLPYQAPEKW